MSYSNIVKCDQCKRTAQKKDTLIVYSPKGPIRLCRDCQLLYYIKELKEKSPGMNINLKPLGVDKNDLFKGAENQFRKIKEGA